MFYSLSSFGFLDFLDLLDLIDLLGLADGLGDAVVLAGWFFKYFSLIIIT